MSDIKTKLYKMIMTGEITNEKKTIEPLLIDFLRLLLHVQIIKDTRCIGLLAVLCILALLCVMYDSSLQK